VWTSSHVPDGEQLVEVARRVGRDASTAPWQIFNESLLDQKA
jgi:hypothetical protein